MRIKVRQWLTREDYTDKPMPMRTMFGTIEQETAKAYYVKLHGKLMPSSNCLHCDRDLKHPISLLYGLGPICGQHFYINPCNTKEELETNYAAMCAVMAKITWEGWIPKTGVLEMEKEEKIRYTYNYNGKTYRTLLDVADTAKQDKIKANAEVISTEVVYV